MDLDLRQVRAFVAAADHGHVGRAADALFLSQQALSKRLARLEEQVGVLFDRTATGVSLTPTGQRFLAPARHLLEVADHALAAARETREPALRVDVWGKLAPVQAMLHAFTEKHPEAVLEISSRQNLRAALAALQRNEIDVAYGNVANLDVSLPDGLSTVLVAVTPAAGLVDERSELAGQDVIALDALRVHGLAIPTQDSLQEFYRFVTEYAAAVDAPISTGTRNLPLNGVVDRMAADQNAVTLVPADWPAAAEHGLRVVSIHPVPLFPWYAVWRTDTPHPLVPVLLSCAQANDLDLISTSEDHWLPAAVRGQGSRPAARNSRS